MRVIRIKEERKKEILNAAKRIFLEKGFEKTTMEDIVARTTLSKGGVYYHYTGTTEILYDLMIEGLIYRINLVRDASKYSERWDDETLINILVDKELDGNEFMSIYVMYLQAAQRNKSLRELMPTLKEEGARMLEKNFGSENREATAPFMSDLLIDLMNSIMLGAEILGARERFKKNRPLFVAMMKLALNYVREGRMAT